MYSYQNKYSYHVIHLPQAPEHHLTTYFTIYILTGGQNDSFQVRMLLGPKNTDYSGIITDATASIRAFLSNSHLLLFNYP
jgi:hypothetical protein